MVVATTIFATVSVMYTGIFISTVRVNGKIIAIQRVQNEIRNVLEPIVRETRLGSINYSYYSQPIENPQSILALKDVVGNDLYYRMHNGIVQMSYNSNTWIDITSDNVRVNKLNFYISPETSPWIISNETKSQPGVLMYMDSNYNKDNKMDGNLKLQTFISSRQYRK